MGATFKVIIAVLSSTFLFTASASTASAFPIAAPVIQGAGVISPVCAQPSVPNGTVLNCGQFFTQNQIVLKATGIGQSQFVAEEHAGWAEFAAELPAHLPGALPFEQWSLRLVAGGDEATVTVYERG